MADRKTATQIMKKKAAIKVELDRRLPDCSETSSQEQADALWHQATEKLASIMESYADASESTLVQRHCHFRDSNK
jgi:hypothetical protein